VRPVQLLAQVRLLDVQFSPAVPKVPPMQKCPCAHRRHFAPIRNPSTSFTGGSMSARTKLNSMYIAGATAVAAGVGSLVGSWLLFFFTAALLIGSAIYAGDVRLKSRRR
jgi:hypothetical protein